MTLASLLLSIDELKDFFRIVGLARADGDLYTNQRDKFLEVSAMAEQLTIISKKMSRRKGVTLLDCGCGKGYLTFVLNYILVHKLRRSAFFIGVDENPRLIQKCIETQHSLGYENMEFHAASIMEFVLDKKPDVTYCLHACDTATDETIAKGIIAGSRFIVVVPCCQRELGHKMRRHPLTSMTQFPAIKERLTSLVTDALRAVVLSAAGYKADIFEFVSSRVTPKNLMFRAERIWLGNHDALEQYWQLRNLFNVKLKIEEYLPWLHPG